MYSAPEIGIYYYSIQLTSFTSSVFALIVCNISGTEYTQSSHTFIINNSRISFAKEISYFTKQFSIKKKKQQLNSVISSVGCKNTPLQVNTTQKVVEDHLFLKNKR